eukprot:gene26389-17567_t
MFVGISSVLLLVGVRASPILPVPTPAQLRYQDTDFVALIHFNMGTYAHNGDPCCDPSNWDVKAAYAAGKTSLPSTFNPTKLNTTQWMDSITSLGAKIAGQFRLWFQRAQGCSAPCACLPQENRRRSGLVLEWKACLEASLCNGDVP